MTTDDARLVSLGARLHLFVQPEDRERFVSLFREVLRCDVAELDFGLPYPIVLVSFADGSAFSVEFSELAPRAPEGAAIDDRNAFRGAWIEFRTANLPAGARAARSRGHPRISPSRQPARLLQRPWWPGLPHSGCRLPGAIAP